MSIKPDDLTENAWSSRAGVSRSWFGDVKKGTHPREDTLDKVLKAIGYTVAQFEELRGSFQPAPGTRRSSDLPFRGMLEPHDVPLVGTAQASDMEVGDNGDVKFVERMDLNMAETIDHLRRPPALTSRRDVYAITVIGDSMAPRFEEGDPLYVDPKRQPRSGDYVVVQLKRSDESAGDEQLYIALLKQLVRRTSVHIELCQIEPRLNFKVPLSEVHAVHRVIPWRELVLF